MISDEEARENINRFGWSLPYPKIEEPDEKLDRLYGDNEDYNHFKDVCYQYGYDHKCLVTNDNLKTVYGKDRSQLNFYEQKAYEWVQYKLEYYFEVVCHRW